MIQLIAVAVLFAVAGFAVGFYVAKRNPKLAQQAPNKL